MQTVLMKTGWGYCDVGDSEYIYSDGNKSNSRSQRQKTELF